MKSISDIMDAPIVETVENTDGDIQLSVEQLDIQTETALQNNKIQLLTTYLGSGLLFVSFLFVIGIIGYQIVFQGVDMSAKDIVDSLNVWVISAVAYVFSNRSD